MVARHPEAMFYEIMGRICHTKTTRDTERRNLGWLSILGMHRLRAPRRGARGLARVRASAAVEQNRPCKQNPPPMPV